MKTKTKPAPITAERLPDLAKKHMPQAPEAEVAVLGSILLDPQRMGDTIETLRPEDFARNAHAAIYAAMIAIYERQGHVDLLSILGHLRDAGTLDLVGGDDYLITLAEAVPDASVLASAVQAVRRKATARALLDAATRIVHHVHSAGDKIDQAVDLAQQEVYAVVQDRTQREAVSIHDLMEKQIDALRDPDGKRRDGLMTGFADLDHLLGGLQPGELILLAARPSMGKTALAMNVAETIAERDPRHCLIQSIEMTREQLAHRLLASRSGVALHQLRTRCWSTDDVRHLEVAAKELARSRLLIDDQASLSVLQIRARARKMMSRQPLSAVIIDYLQLLTSPGAESRQQEVSEISRQLKALARELEVPVIALSQLNRGPESREGHRPRMSDLRDSGSLEQDADVVLLLHREAYYRMNEPGWAIENPDLANVAEVIVGKQRNGPVGVVKLVWDGERARFRSMTLADKLY